MKKIVVFFTEYLDGKMVQVGIELNSLLVANKLGLLSLHSYFHRCYFHIFRNIRIIALESIT